MAKPAKTDLTQGSVKRHILRMLLPFWLAILAMISAGVVDTIFLGHLGVNALAAVGFCFPIIFLGNSLNIGLGAGTMSAISRDIGRKKFSEAKIHGASALVLGLFITVFVTFIGLVFSRQIVTLMGAGEEVLPLSLEYLRFALPAMIFIGIGMLCNNILRASGEAMWPSLIMVSSAIFNIILDPFLIFGIGPFPRLEVAGAAIATLISAILSALFGVFLVVYRRKAVNFTGLFADKGRKTIVKAWAIIGRVGAPAAGSNALVPIAAFMAITIIARNLGKEEVAAMTIAARSEMLMIALLYALSACIGAVTGQNGGAGLTGRVKQAFSFSYMICVLWAMFLALIGVVFAEQIPKFFTKNAEVAMLASYYFKIVPITLAGYGIVFVSAAGLNGLGRPIYGLVYTIIRSLVFYVGFIWLGAMMGGMRGVFIGIAIANIVSGLIAYFYTTRKVPMQVLHH